MKRLILLLPLILIFSSCSIYHINSEDTANDFYPPKDSTDKIVVLEKTDKPYDVIGFITVNTERNQKMPDVIEKMKREAAIMGADAIMDIQSDASGAWKKLPAQKFLGNGYVRANFKSTAIVFK